MDLGLRKKAIDKANERFDATGYFYPDTLRKYSQINVFMIPFIDLPKYIQPESSDEPSSFVYTIYWKLLCEVRFEYGV